MKSRALVWILGLGGLGAVFGLSCNSIIGLDKFEKIDASIDDSSISDVKQEPPPDAKPDIPPDTGLDVVPDAPPEADVQDAVAEDSPVEAEPDVVIDVIPADAPASVRSWAQWLMPNFPLDPDSSLPNHASYTLLDSGVGPGDAQSDTGDADSEGSGEASSPVQIMQDNITGLGWERYPSDTVMTYAAAEQYCASLKPEKQWVIPTRIELATLIDPGRSPHFSLEAFPTAAAIRCWTSSPYLANDAGMQWGVDFQTGVVSPNYIKPTDKQGVRCVLRFPK